jgi:IMP cyclohydrolase
MYLGRIVSIGMTKSGKKAAMYRVSSRSFPNREAREIGENISIMPRPGFEDDLKKNPYITYNCARETEKFVIVSNGSQTDPITEKIAMGMPVRDALAYCSLSMDYEKDAYNTPRITAVVSKEESYGYLAIVKDDALIVRKFDLTPGVAYYVSTYEKDVPNTHNIDKEFDAETAADAAQYVIDGGVFKDFEHPVTSATYLIEDGKAEKGIVIL